MDSKMKGMVMAGMVVLSLVLGLLAVLGSSWMTLDEDGGEANYGLNEAESKFSGVSLTVDYGELCDDTSEDDDEICEMATAGTIGTIGLWVGIVMAGLFAAMMILPMAGIDAMDGIPDIAQKIVSWGAGGMMLLGTLGWMLMRPELENDASLGLSFFMAIIAGILALAAPAMDMFVASDE